MRFEHFGAGTDTCYRARSQVDCRKKNSSNESGDAFDPERAPQKSEGQWTGLSKCGMFQVFATHILTDGQTPSAPTTRRVGFSPTTCPAEIKIEATTNENKGLLYSSILGSPSVSGSFEHMSGCHIFQRLLGFGAHLIWNFGGAIMLGSHQNFRKIRLYSARLSLATHFKFRFCKTTMPRFIQGEMSWENSAPSLKTPVLVS
jgi:hypothetical protein